jgi:hypothetical protein
VTISDFIKLVGQMRGFQSEFFATRNRTVLARAKDSERLVDRALQKLAPSADDNYDRDCKQLGELFLNFDGERFEFASLIVPHPGLETNLQSLEVANGDNTSRYRILFKIEEV